MKSNAISTLGIICTLLGSSSAYGSLSLLINHVDKTFALTGSDSGSPFTVAAGGLTRWVVTGIGFDGGRTESVSYADDQVFSTSVGTPGGLFPFDTTLNTDETNLGSFSFMLATSTGSFQTLTGLGNFKSYANFSAANQAKFEALVGRSFNETTGGGFSPLTAIAVPEPSSLLLTFAAGAGLVCRRRRA